MQEVWVWSMGQEGPLEKEMATHASIPPWRIPPIQESGGLQSKGSQRVRQNWVTNIFTFLLNSMVRKRYLPLLKTSGLFSLQDKEDRETFLSSLAQISCILVK